VAATRTVQACGLTMWVQREKIRSGPWTGGMIRGRAADDSELFEFTIQPFVAGGFTLTIRYRGACHHNITGAGVWPTVSRAKEIAEECAARLLRGAGVTWSGTPG
jgi:hypothetical protein